jgi:hypothetical protein
MTISSASSAAPRIGRLFGNRRVERQLTAAVTAQLEGDGVCRHVAVIEYPADAAELGCSAGSVKSPGWFRAAAGSFI